MRVRIIQGIIPLLFLLTSTAAMAETVIIDFYGTVLYTEGSPPSGMSADVGGHVELNSEDIFDSSSEPGVEAEFEFQGAGSFGAAAAGPGWLFPANPEGQYIEVDI
jgi:hypothetical protein